MKIRTLITTLVTAVVFLALFAGVAHASIPPAWITVTNAAPIAGHTGIGVTLTHATGWKWDGCSVSGSYTTFVPSTITRTFSHNISPSGNPYHAALYGFQYEVDQVNSVNATCTLKHLTKAGFWVFRQRSASW